MNLQVCTRSSWSAASGILLFKSVSHHERQATAAWEVTVRYGTWLLIDSPQLAVRGAQDQVMLYLLGCFLVSLSHSLTALRGLFWLVFIPDWVFSFNRTEALRYLTWLNFGSSLRVEQSITNQSNKARFLWPVPSVRQGIHMNPSSTESKVVGVLTMYCRD